MLSPFWVHLSPITILWKIFKRTSINIEYQGKKKKIKINALNTHMLFELDAGFRKCKLVFCFAWLNIYSIEEVLDTKKLVDFQTEFFKI